MTTSPAAFEIPSVIESNLYEFHRRHFAPLATSQFASAFLSSTTGQDLSYGDSTAEDLEDDGLGYYPDGVKRTLTQEQVDMFRHSEIQAILRQRRLRAEQDGTSMKDSDEETRRGLEPDDGHSITAANRPTHEQPAEEDDFDTDDEEYERFLRREREDIAEQNRDNGMALEYGGSDVTGDSASHQVPTWPARKRIFYGDVDEGESAHTPTASEGAEKASRPREFAWPRIGS